MINFFLLLGRVVGVARRGLYPSIVAGARVAYCDQRRLPGSGGFFYDTRGLFILAVPVLGAFNLSGLFALGYDFTLERLEKLQTRRTLERYVSKNLVKEILENPDSFYSSLRVRFPYRPVFRYRGVYHSDRKRRSRGAGQAAE